MEVIFLGTGTSQGIPVIGCTCEVCISDHQEDKRLRTSVLIKTEGLHILIDTSPDFRTQMLDNHEDNVDAILLTHEHNDHVIGLDDVRPINFKFGKNIPVYSLPRVLAQVKQKFHYAFSESAYPGAPRLNCMEIEAGDEFWIQEKIKVQALAVSHATLPVLGFRIQDFVYITDASSVPEETMVAIHGVKVLVLNALQRKKHFSHFNLDEALEVIQQLKPDKTFLTHLSHHMGKHHELIPELPEGVLPACDKMRINI